MIGIGYLNIITSRDGLSEPEVYPCYTHPDHMEEELRDILKKAGCKTTKEYEHIFNKTITQRKIPIMSSKLGGEE